MQLLPICVNFFELSAAWNIERYQLDSSGNWRIMRRLFANGMSISDMQATLEKNVMRNGTL